MNTLTKRVEWQALQAHQKTIASFHMQDWFNQDPQRFSRFSLTLEEIFLDYSKNRITTETLNLLSQLATATHLPKKINALFSGEAINSTEKRPALHVALRAPEKQSIYVNGQNIMPTIHATLKKMGEFIEKVHNATWRGVTGKPIRDIVNIGIGGSHLGPLMTVSALADFAKEELCCHFISNIDSAHLNAVLKEINPESTLFIISSKSFSTLETITNAETLRHWLQTQLNTQNIAPHFIAITGATEKAMTFGIPKENIFDIWDWVGGRYSIWSAIGLPLALLIGMDHFLEFLAGAHSMDQHFQHTEFTQNMPVLMGLLGIWYINFFGTTHHAIVPYSHPLNYLRSHIQQLDMESNGKNITQYGETIRFLTGPVILGEQGCNGQHAFHQLFHQGNHLIPVDFILTGKRNNELDHHHAILVSSGLSQAKALMQGKSYAEALAEIPLENNTLEERKQLAKHKVIPGNRPSNFLFINRLTPRNLGALIALYEHKTFVQGAIWDINSFDQWGVELGKNLLPPILAALNAQDNILHDSSTAGLIQHYRTLRKNV
ncbi:MAG: pgi [Gammaproteobacteria bacterium]|jgi:glucose-6-phosphate isomerase|nr:pgi [Gammaproteobacteria bacterium]